MFTFLRKKYKRFNSWMRYDPPGALSAKGWRLFEAEFKERAPIRYFINEEFRRAWLLPIKWKYKEICNWARYRTFDRYHILDTGLKPGYYDVPVLMLHINFNMLKDFIEIEQAWHAYICSSEMQEKASWAEKHLPFYRVFVPFRRPELGIRHLEWASSLDDPSLPVHERSVQQAVDAREALELYKWWVELRPARVEIEHAPYDEQGLGPLGCFDADFDRNAEDYKAHIISMNAASQQEEEWKREDEEMLIRLMKVRQGLWT